MESGELKKSTSFIEPELMKEVVDFNDRFSQSQLMFQVPKLEDKEVFHVELKQFKIIEGVDIIRSLNGPSTSYIVKQNKDDIFYEKIQQSTDKKSEKSRFLDFY